MHLCQARTRLSFEPVFSRIPTNGPSPLRRSMTRIVPPGCHRRRSIVLRKPHLLRSLEVRVWEQSPDGVSHPRKGDEQALESREREVNAIDVSVKDKFTGPERSSSIQTSFPSVGLSLRPRLIPLDPIRSIAHSNIPPIHHLTTTHRGDDPDLIAGHNPHFDFMSMSVLTLPMSICV